MLDPDRLQYRIPTPALVLGVAGLIPFVALPLVAWLDRKATFGLSTADLTSALVTYAAVILSFMGGAQWGLGVARVQPPHRAPWRAYGISVLPALIGWVALALPMPGALSALAAAFVLLLAYDLWTVRRGEAPVWYARLRIGLTTIVVAALSLSSLL